MISVADALGLVKQHAGVHSATRLPLAQCLGLTLAEDVISDIDSPPHDKTLVDGYAVVAADFVDGKATLQILEEVAAGAVPTQTVRSGFTSRIFTGAPIPAGADAVVMIERSELLAGESNKGLPRVLLADAKVRTGQNIMRQGQSLRKGQCVLRNGHRLRAIEIGLLAEVGNSTPAVIARPTIAILATGNELVPVQEFPTAGKIRNSNSPMLAALATNAGGDVIDLGVARDELDDLRTKIAAGLNRDMLILSGGVSAGNFDLVPKVLAELGVRQVFHKVNLKPGKPIWFGVLKREHGQTLVFGLPGNPVSSLVCFELFARPAIEQLLGIVADRPLQSGRLAVSFTHRGDRPTFFPARRDSVPNSEKSPTIQLLDWQGSADLRTLTEANCLVHFPSGDRSFSAGDEITFRPMD